ncbi:MAG: hypothetical protein NUV85_02560 [Candidatus Berkelbacteria bacterium]|nr:hypothetical protein [Candidatus Berkelbacteria bacterium]
MTLESTKYLHDLIIGLSSLESSSPQLLEEAGISFNHPFADNVTNGRIYTIIRVNESGQREVASIPIKDGQIDLLSTKLSRINPKGNDQDNLHVLNPNIADIKKYVSSILERIDSIRATATATQPKAPDEPEQATEQEEIEPDSPEKVEEQPEANEAELGVGDTFKLSEQFRTDAQAADWRQYLGDSFFHDVDENKRTKKIMESIFIVSDIDDDGFATLKVRKNGGYSEEEAIIPTDYLKQLTGK